MRPLVPKAPLRHGKRRARDYLFHIASVIITTFLFQFLSESPRSRLSSHHPLLPTLLLLGRFFLLEFLPLSLLQEICHAYVYDLIEAQKSPFRREAFINLQKSRKAKGKVFQTHPNCEDNETDKRCAKKKSYHRRPNIVTPGNNLSSFLNCIFCRHISIWKGTESQIWPSSPRTPAVKLGRKRGSRPREPGNRNFGGMMRSRRRNEEGSSSWMRIQ